MAVTLAEWLAACPLIAILRGVRPDEVEAVASALETAGIRVVEVPLNSPEPMTSIRLLVERFADRLLIGAGTVRRAAEVSELAAIGARLIVMPHSDPAVVRAAKQLDLIACPGFATPTEAFSMIDAGADGLKLFPAEAASPAVLRALRAVLPREVPVMPVGGIDHTNLVAWSAAGAAGFGIGSAIYRAGDDADAVAAKAARLVGAIRPSV